MTRFCVNALWRANEMVLLNLYSVSCVVSSFTMCCLYCYRDIQGLKGSCGFDFKESRDFTDFVMV